MRKNNFFLVNECLLSFSTNIARCDLRSECENLLKISCKKLNLDFGAIYRDKHGKPYILNQKFYPFRYGPVYSAHLLEIIQKKCTDTLMVQRIQELVNIEQNVRNVAAHNIVSVTPEWIKERTGKSVDDIFWILKYICEQVKINTRKENWNSYDSMNKRIIDELDKD